MKTQLRIGAASACCAVLAAALAGVGQRLPARDTKLPAAKKGVRGEKPAMPQIKAPVTFNTKGEVYLQNSEIKIDDLVPKLQAITQVRGGSDERIYVRGDKKVDYGTVMRVMGRLSAAGYRRVALVTEVEQGS